MARLLGLRLLKLDAVVVLGPADVAPPSSASQAARPRPSNTPPARSGTGRSRLADAVRSIDEGAEILAEARRNGSF